VKSEGLIIRSSVLISTGRGRERFSGSSQTISFPDAPSVFPIFTPEAVVRSGKVSPWALPPLIRRIRSIPAVMFPHWSFPPAWTAALILVEVVKIVAWSSM
jgi:hypothetical protein